MNVRLQAVATPCVLVASAVAGAAMSAVHPIAPVAVVCGAAVGGWLVSSPFRLLMGFIAVLFTRPGDFSSAIAALQPGKLFAVGALITTIFVRLLRQDIRFPRSPHNFAMAALIGGAFISAVRGTDPGTSIAEFNDVMVKIAILYVLLMVLVDSPRRVRTLQWTLASLDAGIGGYALFTKLTGQAQVEGSRAALVGLLGDPNDLAFTLLMSAPFLIAAAWTGEVRTRRRARILLVLVVGGILSTQSRGGLLALAAGGGLVMFDRIRSKAVVVGIMVVGLGLAGAVSGLADRQSGAVGGGHEELDESAQGRLDAWKAGGRMLMRNPIDGVGFNRFADNYESYASNVVIWGKHETHNAYIKCAAETGVIGLLPFLALVFLSLRASLRCRALASRFEPADATLLSTQLANLAGLLVSAFFLSQTWMWFLYILFTQTAIADRVYTITAQAADQSRAENHIRELPNQVALASGTWE